MVLPKSMRLKGHRCFDHIHKFGTRYHGSAMVIRVVRAKPGLTKFPSNQSKNQPGKCAVAISNKVSKKAVVRNRLRRFLHNHLRKRLATKLENSNYWALLSLKPNSLGKESVLLLNECDKLLLEAGLLT